MASKKLATVTCHMISSYGNTAKNMIHAYRVGGERVIGLLDERWDQALKQSRSKLGAGVAKNANAVHQALQSYSLKGLSITSSGAQGMVNRVVKLADAGVHTVAFNAARFEDKTGARALTSLAHVALPGADALNSLASQIEQKSADLASKVAGDNLVAKVAKRARTATRKPTSVAKV
jgi:hypothetical protein